ncbi:cytochrome P450 [Nocardia sp. NBC_00565]|uniref:cytochrome P450 n=1 Tax=Nocardia sp. NBC_00565 TaxID=2975993 RepID=UPI002E8236D6|nr:cytochrome P450 [Nocardia sp. NBC_00565]WUC07091.1 cytochrome P450 [Nocardia sp. NBC_00565]
MTTDLTSAAFLDIFNPQFDFDSPEVARAREQNWYADSPIGPIALRHREVSALLRDSRFRLGGEAYMALHGITEGPLFHWWMNTLMSVDDDSHTRLRGLVGKAFTPRVVENLRPFTRTTAARLADQIAEQVSLDFVSAFADPLPALVICELLGVPTEDYDQFHGWSADIGLAFATGGLDGEVLDRVDHAVTEMSTYIASLITRRRAAPGTDLISALIAAQSDGGSLSAGELHNLVLLLVWAGQDTTSRQLGRALVAFSEHPDQWELLRADPSLVPHAVAEIFRWTPQARMIQRFANIDCSLGGLDFSADSVVFSCIPAANRDPRVFENPTCFDIRRTPQPRELVFGGGTYHCIGVALAHLEMAEGLTALVNRLGPPTVTGPVHWRPHLAMIHGPDFLPITFSG